MKILTDFNFSFFGGWREGRVIDGHIHMILDEEQRKFAVHKFGDYGGLQWYPDEDTYPELPENSMRYVHDRVLSKINDFKNIEPDFKIDFGKLHFYDLKEVFISKNIQKGDTVLEIDENRELKIENFHALDMLNRDYQFKIINRNVEHPKAATVEQLVEAYNKYGNPFEYGNVTDKWDGRIWKPLAGFAHKDVWHVATFMIDGKPYEEYCYHKKNNEYVWTTPEGRIYTTWGVSGKVKEVVEYLGHFVHRRDSIDYYLKEVIEIPRYTFTGSDKKVVTPYVGAKKVFKEKESYYINTRLTYV